MKKAFSALVFLFCALLLASCSSVEEPSGSNQAPLTFGFEKMNEEDAELIVRLCYNEMKGEPLLAKTAFCAMVLNRLENESFPDTVDGVVFETNAFHSTEKKAFYEDMNPTDARRDRLALYYVLEKEYDPTGGALFCRKTSDPECYEIVPSFSVSDLVFGNP